MMRLGKICGCVNGATVAKWNNGTLVHKTTSCADATVLTVPPYQRHAGGTGFGDCSANPLYFTLVPSDWIGGWFFGGDGLGGVPSQAVAPGLDDVFACAVDDATHFMRDHNCYVQDATATKDYRQTLPRGAAFVFGRKKQHGRPGFLADVACAADPTKAPFQVRYLKMDVTCDFVDGLSCTRVSTPNAGGSPTTTNVNFGLTAPYSNFSTQEIGRFTGLKSATSGGYVFGGVIMIDEQPRNNPIGLSIGSVLTSWSAGCNAFNFNGTPLSLADLAALFTDLNPLTDANSPTLKAAASYVVDICTMTDTQLELHVTLQPNSLTYNNGTDTIVQTASGSSTFHFKVVLSKPYTAADCLAEYDLACAAWDLSSGGINLNPLGAKYTALRRDEQLALAPMCWFDECGPTVPVDNFTATTMDDYNAPVNDASGYAPWTTGTASPPAGWTYVPGQGGDWTPTWAQIAWLDPNGYIWRTSGNVDFTIPPDGTLHATLVTGVFTGTRIAASGYGFERHFWFGFQDDNYNGAFSASPIPEAALRWTGGHVQGVFDNGHTGYFYWPQGWLYEKGAYLFGGKYVEAKEAWPTVDWAGPNGKMKFAVDQTTVCATVTPGLTGAGGSIIIQTTAGATAPGTAGGINAGDMVMIGGDGIYPVTFVSGVNPSYVNYWSNTVSAWTLTLGARVDVIPAGVDINAPADGRYAGVTTYVGKMRFWSAPGFGGKVAATTSYDAGTGLVTLVPSVALPYVRTGDVVCVTDDTRASSGQLSNVLATLTLTRVDDTHFTASHAAITGAVWMVPQFLYDGVTPGTKWYFHTTASRGDFVQLQWDFNYRQAALATGAQPNWLGGSGAGTGTGTVGCLAAHVANAYIKKKDCHPPMVGTVPFYKPTIKSLGTKIPRGPIPRAKPVETFPNQNLAVRVENFSFDDTYMALSNQAIETAMVNPYAQTPFTPDGDGVLFSWHADDGSGQADYSDVLTGLWHRFYPALELVEALSVPNNTFGAPDPAAQFPAITTVFGTEAPPALPADVKLVFDPTNILQPPAPMLATDSVWRPHGFLIAACANIAGSGRFSAVYATFCPC